MGLEHSVMFHRLILVFLVVVGQAQQFNISLTNVSSSSSLVYLNQSAPSSDASISGLAHPAWDAHIRDLEHLLEADLERVEYDASHNASLADDLMHVRQDIDRLVQSVKEVEESLNRTKTKLTEEERDIVRKTAAIETEKFIDGLHRGKINVKVDYVTGQLVPKPKKKKKLKNTQIGGNVTMSLLTNGTISHGKLQPPGPKDSSASDWDEVVNAATMDDDDVLQAQEKKRASESLRQHIASHPDIKTRIQQEVEYLKSGSDPAVLTFDVHLMLDIVKLAMTASLFGLAAVFLRLPPTAGFLLGGMMIGPSCLDLIGEIHQVQTLAQFGTIFLLFEQGLLYSQTYNEENPFSSGDSTDEAPDRTIYTVSSSSEPSTLHSRNKGPSPRSTRTVRRPPSFLAEDDHDPHVVGSIILILLVFVALVVVIFTNVAASVPEAVMVSCTIAICSTTIVAESLETAHIANTHWGIGVMKMISMHDLFMVPLLALPELLSSLNKSASVNDDDVFDSLAFWSLSSVFGRLALVAVFLKGSTILATHIIRAASFADSRLSSVKGELFTLSVVAYALFIATVSDELSMSIEAGSVLAGIALFRSPYVPKVVSSIQPITSVFGGMYLTSLGMIISPMFVVREAGSIVELVCLIGMFKLLLVSVALNRFFDYAITPSVAVGSAMAQISEVSLLVLAKSQRMGLIRRKTYLLLIPTTCFMLTMAPLSAALLRRLPKVQEHTDDLPSSLFFLKYLRVFKHPKRKRSSPPLYSALIHNSSDNLEDQVRQIT